MSFVTYLVTILVVFVILKIISIPGRFVKRILINSAIGGLVVFGLSLFNIGFEVTWLSALIVGVLGIPGIIIVAIMHFLI